MDLSSIFEPLLIIHFEFNSKSYDVDYTNDYRINTRILKDDEGNIVGFAAIMKSRLNSKKGDFVSYIAQQDVLVEMELMKVGHFETFIHHAQLQYVEEFYQKAQVSPEQFSFQVVAHPEDLDSLYNELCSKL